MKLKLYLTQKNEQVTSILQDLVLKANADNLLDCFFYDEDDNMVDITGATINFIVKEKSTDEDENALLDKEVTDLTEASLGEAEIEIAKDDCKDLEGNYLYSIKVTLAEKEYIVAEGNICFQKNLFEGE